MADPIRPNQDPMPPEVVDPGVQAALEFGSAAPFINNAAALSAPTGYDAALMAQKAKEEADAQAAIQASTPAPTAAALPANVGVDAVSGGATLPVVPIDSTQITQEAYGSVPPPEPTQDPYRVDAPVDTTDSSKTEVATSGGSQTIEDQIIDANDRANRLGDQAENSYAYADALARQGVDISQKANMKDSDHDGIPDAAEEDGEVSAIMSKHDAAMAQIDEDMLGRRQKVYDTLKEVHETQYRQMQQAIDEYSKMYVNPNELWAKGGAAAQIGMVGSAMLDMYYGMSGWTDGKSFSRVWDKALETNIAIQRGKMEAQSSKIKGFEQMWELASANATTEQGAIDNAKALLTAHSAGDAVKALATYKSAAAVRDKMQAIAKSAQVNASMMRMVGDSQSKSMQLGLTHAERLLAEQTRRAKLEQGDKTTQAANAAGARNSARKFIGKYKQISEREGIALASGIIGRGPKDAPLSYISSPDADGNMYPQVFYDPTDIASAAGKDKVQDDSTQRAQNIGLVRAYAKAWEIADKNHKGKWDGVKTLWNGKISELPPDIANIKRLLVAMTAAKVKNLAGASFTESEQKRLEEWLGGSVTDMLGQVKKNTNDAIQFLLDEDRSYVMSWSGGKGRFAATKGEPGTRNHDLYELSRQMGKPGPWSPTGLGLVAAGEVDALKSGDPAAPKPAFTTNDNVLSPNSDFFDAMHTSDMSSLSAADKRKIEAAKARRDQIMESTAQAIGTVGSNVADKESLLRLTGSIARYRDAIGGSSAKGAVPTSASLPAFQAKTDAAAASSGDDHSGFLGSINVNSALAKVRAAAGAPVERAPQTQTSTTLETQAAKAKLNQALAMLKASSDRFTKERIPYDSDIAKAEIGKAMRLVDVAFEGLKEVKLTKPEPPTGKPKHRKGKR